MPSDPVNVEPWKDHRVMLVSPEIADMIRLYQPVTARYRDERQAFVDAFDAAPRVYAYDDAIRWLTNRQAPGENHAAR